MRYLITFVILVGWVWGQACPSPYISTRCDLATIQLPPTLPTWTPIVGIHAGDPLYGAGISATTTEFGFPTIIFRLTDLTNNCNPNASTLYSSGQVANSGSGDETHFNTNSTLVILGGTGGWVCPEAVTIAGSSLSFSRIDNNFSFPITVNSVMPSYNSSAPNLMYAMNNAVIQTYDFTGYGPAITAPTPSTYYDFTASANCLGGAYGVPTWVDHLSSAKYPPDSMFGEAFSNAGGQDTGSDIVVYKPGSGCIHYNTSTGAITGDWGAAGTISLPDRFKVHNAILSKDGAWMVITYASGTCTSCSTPNNSIQYFWQVGTTTMLISCSSSRCGGHFTEGSEKFVNFSGSSTFQEEIRPFAGSPNPYTDLKAGISTCTGPGLTMHSGWPNVDPADSYPYFETWTSTDTGLPGDTFTCPFQNELDSVSPAGVGSSAPGAGTVWRQAHTFNSGQQSSLFSCQNAIGAMSTDGRIAIWETDGMGAFGSTSGGPTCSGTTCRCEVLGLLLPQSGFFGSSWNHLSASPPPPIWPPTDSLGHIVPITSNRLHDDGLKWSQIETANGTYNWTVMDEVVRVLSPSTNPKMQVIYTVSSTPKWAGTCASQADPSVCLPGSVGSGFGGGTQCASPSDYSCLPPSDIAADGTGTDAQFQAFISVLVARYTGQIAYYGEWNEQDSPNFWCPGATGSTGCPATTTAAFKIAVRMNWDMWNEVHCLSPGSLVLSPGFHGFSSGAGGWMNLYSNTSINAPAGNIAGCTWAAQTVTGKQTFDITDWHNHSATAESLIATYNGAVGEITRDSLPTEMFADEIGCNGIGQCINQDTLASYVARTYVLCASLGPPIILECNYYQWDSNGGVALQGTISGLAYYTVQGWLNRSQVSNYTLVSTTYTVPVVLSSGVSALIAWDTSQNCTSGCTIGSQVFGSQYSFFYDIAGVSHNTTGGNGTAPVGLKPIMLVSTGGGAPSPPTNLQITSGSKITKGTLIN